jgi:glutaredoxin
LDNKDRFDVITCSDCAELRELLATKHDIHLEKVTFPQILENNILIGGYTDLCKYIEERNDIFEIDDCF